MATRVHDAEPDTSPGVVRTLLQDQVPDVAGLPLERLGNTGSDNALYRLGGRYVVRLPRLADAAGRLGVELSWLPRLAGLPVAVPEVVHVGEPTEAYPHRWAVVRWLDGVDAWGGRHHEDWFGPDLGRDLAAVVGHLRGMSVADAPPRDGRLTAVLDWGVLGAGDPAEDLSPAWSVLDAAGAAAFREALDVDEQSWSRGRGFALEQAIGGVAYYVPRRHPLGDVMQRTLERLLSC